MVAAQIAMPMMASTIAIPSAEALSTMAGIDHAQLSTSIESIIANALQGGGGSNIDTLLSALPGQGIAADAGLDALASLGNGTVPAWDMGQGAGFTFAGANLMTSEALVLHHDAIQPIANG
jgi:tartrate dehydratase alpha subunit/fumarate hydratase class I-like protein